MAACGLQRVSKNTIDNDKTHSRSPSPRIKDTINYKLPDFLIHPLAVSIGRDNSSYHIKKDSEEKYVAITYRHNFITILEKDGITMHPQNNANGWEIGMNLIGIGYNNVMRITQMI